MDGAADGRPPAWPVRSLGIPPSTPDGSGSPLSIPTDGTRALIPTWRQSFFRTCSNSVADVSRNAGRGNSLAVHPLSDWRPRSSFTRLLPVVRWRRVRYRSRSIVRPRPGWRGANRRTWMRPSSKPGCIQQRRRRPVHPADRAGLKGAPVAAVAGVCQGAAHGRLSVQPLRATPPESHEDQPHAPRFMCTTPLCGVEAETAMPILAMQRYAPHNLRS